MKWRLLFFLLSWSATAFTAESDRGNISEIGEKIISDVIRKKSEAQKEVFKNESVTLFGQIDPFEDIVVLQRRFLPKKERYELNGAFGLLTDNPFFITSVFFARFAYSFTEAWGLEASYFKTSTSESKVTKNLRKKNVVSSISAVPNQYYGLDVKWNPVYGKLSFWNETIIPIDNYYVLGAGQVDLETETAVALHVGTGVTFGLQKWLAARLALDFYRYSASAGGTFLDTHINIGFSWFFPSAEYR